MIGYNLWAIPVGGAILCLIWRQEIKARFSKNKKAKPGYTEVRKHQRKIKPKTEKEIEQAKFEKNHMRGLKGNNPTKFARKLRIKNLIKRRDEAAEKCEKYFRVGEFKKSTRYGNLAAKFDNEINATVIQ